MIIRRFVESDFDQILSLFYHTVREVNVRDYSAEQVAVWAPDEPDLDRWRKSLLSKYVFVAEESRLILGFAELEESGHIDRFYVSKDHIGQGVGKAIYHAIEIQAHELGVSRLFVEASITAKPFFASRGFLLCQEQTVDVRGVKMTNFVMEKTI